MSEAQTFKTQITAEHRLFDLHIRETLQYRDLIFLFVKAVRAAHRGRE